MINKYAEYAAAGKEIIKTAPDSPGCYLFKDKSGAVIYAGKAKNLRRRVGRYFYPGAAGHTPKNLTGNIAEVEYITADTELNALLLEYRLIKHYKPRYNSQLKADVKHPYLRITDGAEYPALSVAQEKAPDAARYYGFLYDNYDAQDALRILHRAWRVPLCGKDRFSPRAKACLYYHIGSCLGPCEGLIAPAAYHEIIGEILRFLDGGRTGVMSRVQKRMDRASRAGNFERAAADRDILTDLRRLQKKAGRLFDITAADRLVLFIRPFKAREYSIFYCRAGNIQYRFDSPQGKPEDVELFLQAYRTAAVPADGNDWPPGALGELFADKQFAVLPPGGSSAQDARLIRGAYQKWNAARDRRLMVDRPTSRPSRRPVFSRAVKDTILLPCPE